MVNWRTYKIIGKSVSSNRILFYLDNYVNYSNGSYNYKHIYCSNNSPFYNWREGDFIEIDNDVSSYRNSGYCFGSTSEVRINCRYVCGHSHGEYDDLSNRYSTLERERNDLRADRDSGRKKYDEIKDQLNNEKIRSANELANERLNRQSTESTLRSEKKLVEEKLENLKVEKVGFLKQIEEGKKELSLVRTEKDNQLKLKENELTQKDNKLKELEKAMEVLRVKDEKVISQRDNSLKETSGELRRKEREIEFLQNERFKTQEDLLIWRLNSEKDNLEVLASDLGIDLEKVHDLTKEYRKLLFARKEGKRNVVEESEGKIAKTKQTLLNSEINMENIRKIGRECERLAGLSWDLEQIQQQYEARQEVPPK